MTRSRTRAWSDADPVEEPEVLVEPEDEDDQPGRDVIIMFAVFFEGGLAPLSLFLGWWLGHNPLPEFSWDLLDALWGAAGHDSPCPGLPVACSAGRSARLKQIKDFCEEEFVPLLAGSSWSDMALIAISAGVGEEMLFRGVLQILARDLAGGRLGPGRRQHPLRAAPPDLAPLCFRHHGGRGLYLGAAFLFTGNLLTVMVTHALYDFTLMAYLLEVHRTKPADRDGIPTSLPTRTSTTTTSRDDFARR